MFGRRKTDLLRRSEQDARRRSNGRARAPGRLRGRAALRGAGVEAVSSAARSKAETATSPAPRSVARFAAASSASATASSGPDAAAARCQTARSGSSASASARAACALRSWSAVAACFTAETIRWVPESKPPRVERPEAGGDSGRQVVRVQRSFSPPGSARRGRGRRALPRRSSLCTSMPSVRESRGKCLLEPSGQRQRAGMRRACAELRRSGRELDQGERVSGGLLEDPSPDLDRQARCGDVEERI